MMKGGGKFKFDNDGIRVQTIVWRVRKINKILKVFFFVIISSN